MDPIRPTGLSGTQMNELQQTARALAELALSALGQALGDLAAGKEPPEPFVMADRDADGRAIYRFDAEPADRARDGAQAWIAQESAGIRRYAFAWAGEVTHDDRQWSAIFVEAGDRALPTAMLVCQRYGANGEPDGKTCRIGEPMLVGKPGSRLMCRASAND